MPSQTFTSDGSFDVPDGVEEVTVELWGESGDDADGDGVSSGGDPGRVKGTLSVTPLETLYARFGGGGAAGTGNPQNGGAGGDHADIRQGGTALGDRQAVAGGGGGNGAGFDNGGDGGADVGQDGGDAAGGSGGSGGQGGDQSSGGEGGLGDLGAGVTGDDGASGSGGDGGGGGSTTTGGGGGGSGWFGGGGGGSSNEGDGGGGGGGGSNYDDGLASVAANVQGDTSGTERQATLTWTDPAPQNLSATAIDSDTIDLSWRDNFADEDGFNIYRSTASSPSYPGDYTQIDSVAADVESYTDSGLTNGTTYTYVVTATDSDGFGESEPSNSDSATSELPPPKNVRVHMTVAGDENHVLWDKADTNTSGDHEVYRSTSSGSLGTLQATLGQDAESYTDTSVSTGTTYYYTVRRNTSSESADSAQVGRDPGAAAPENLSATNVGETSLTLEWDDITVDETGFDIERRRVYDDGPSPWQTIASGLAADTESHTDSDLRPGKTYEYRITVSDT